MDPIDAADEAWQADSDVLATIGAHLFRQPTRISVRLPLDLARLAVASWQRDEPTDHHLNETDAQAVSRQRSGALALIGLAIETDGVPEGDSVLVDLDAWQIGDAFAAAEDAGLLQDRFRPG